MAAAASATIAQAYVERLVTALEGLSHLPERHPLPPELGPEMRGFVFKSTLVIAYRVRGDTVVLAAMFGRGQKLQPLKAPP